MTYGAPRDDVAPLHDSMNGPTRFEPPGWDASPHMVAVDPVSPTDAPTHTSNGQRTEGWLASLYSTTLPTGKRESKACSRDEGVLDPGSHDAQIVG